MSPKTATLTSVSLLLALSALCVGGRQYVDARHEATRRRAAGDTIAASPPPVQNPNPIPGRTSKPVSGSDRDWFTKQLRIALSTQDEATRTRALLELVSRFTEDDWEPALAAVEEMGIGKGYPNWAFILAAWTEASPVKALDWSIGMKAGWTAGLKTWMGRDPDAAMAYIASRKGDDWSTAVLLRARAIDALEDDLPRLGRFLALGRPAGIDVAAVDQASPTFKKHTPERLQAWIATLGPTAKPHGFRMIMKTLQGYEQQAALAREFPDLGESYQGHIHAAWAREDPAAATAALEKMEPGQARKGVIGGIITVLSQKNDFAGVFALTHRYPEDMTSGYLNDLINDAMIEHPELAVREIPRLESEDTQIWQYRLALNQWLEKDPAAAKEWLAENEIPYQLRKELEGKPTQPLDGEGK